MQHKRCKQKQRQLCQAKRIKPFCAQIKHNRAGRHTLEDKRNRRRESLAKTPINGQPQDRGKHHQPGGKHQHVAGEFLIGRQYDRLADGAKFRIKPLVCFCQRYPLDCSCFTRFLHFVALRRKFAQPVSHGGKRKRHCWNYFLSFLIVD